MMADSDDRTARIMIVEDESIVAEDLQQALEGMGYRVLAARSSGEAALRAAAEEPPDLVLMDIVLAGAMDGVETSERLRREYGIPVVFLTAYADAEILQRAKATGPFGYVLKPFDLRELRGAIEVALHRHRAEQEVRRARDEWEATFDAVPDHIMILDDDYRVRRVNRALADFLSIGPEEAAQRYCYELIHGTNGPLEACPHTRLLGDDGIHGGEYFEPRFGRHFYVTVSRLRDHAGRLDGVVHVSRDITERKEREREREEYFSEIKDAVARARRPGNLIRVCTGCLKVNGVGGSWQALDRYLHEHWDSRFSTARCPDCIDRKEPIRATQGGGAGPDLSRRENEVLRWLAEGKNTWEIARILGIKQRTVKFHVAHIKEKLGVPTRIQAVIAAVQAGLLRAEE